MLRPAAPTTVIVPHSAFTAPNVLLNFCPCTVIGAAVTFCHFPPDLRLVRAENRILTATLSLSVKAKPDLVCRNIVFLHF